MSSSQGPDYISSVSAILEKHSEIHSEYHFTSQGYDFIGLPEVISPEISSSTNKWRGLPHVADARFLEIGCGTGVFAILAALNGAVHVVATDINPHAVANTILNAKHHNVDGVVEVLQSDIFEQVPPQQFDIILWNIPWLDTPKTNLSILEQASFDPGYTLLKRYLQDAGEYLKPDGVLYLGYSSSLGSLEVLTSYCDKFSWTLGLEYQVRSEDGTKVELFKLVKKS